METTFIYTLSDKRGNIRYVGKTSREIKKRLYSHIKESQSSKISHKINWIKSLLNNNERPIIEIIDIVPTTEWVFWEQYWIDQFRQWGFNLTNLTIGGEGSLGYKHTELSKQKMKSSKLGTKLPQEQRDKISNSVKQKFIDAPNYNKCYDKKITLDKDFLYHKYIIENLSMPKLASLLNVSEKTIFNNLKEYNISKPKEIWLKQLSTHPKKIVLQYDLNGNFIKEWNGLTIIQEELCINKANIANCCRGIAKSAGGFIWRYKDDIDN